MNFYRFVLLLLLPNLASAAYDASSIKQNLQNQKESFKILEWKQTPNNTWKAITKLKRTSIIVAHNQSQIILPFINPTQIKNGKHLCETFGTIALSPVTPEKLAKIKSTIRQATTRHHVKFFKQDGLQFIVAPKLIGSVVSLHCTVKLM